MSLKAKLEAVIYAAEEPVTLSQLATLFAPDALEWRAEQEAEAAERAAEAAAAESLPLLNAELAELEPEAALAVAEAVAASEVSVESAEASQATQILGTESAQVSETSAAVTPESGAIASEGLTAEPVTASEVPANPADVEAEAKRLARQRDREVKAILRQLLDELIATYEADNRGIEIREIAGGYRMATKPECHDAVRIFVKSLKPALKLSLPALETLAVIAYKQPITAPEVNEIRGVESSGVFGSLLARKLIATAGRKQVIGRPILYKTTKEFLLRFGLKDVSELPSMEEFEKMAAIELEEPDPEGQPTEPGAAAEFDENATEESKDSPDSGTASESAETSADETPAPQPVDNTKTAESEETPAVMAAESTPATEVPAEPETAAEPEASSEVPEASSVDEPAAEQPADQVESTPA